MKHDVDLTKAELSWCMEILKKIKESLDSESSDADKVAVAKWLVKQALKVEREE
jgi:hypothetical protein